MPCGSQRVTCSKVVPVFSFVTLSFKRVCSSSGHSSAHHTQHTRPPAHPACHQRRYGSHDITNGESSRSGSHLLCLCASVCRAAKADLVFLVDGSWSIGDDNFQKIIRFLYSTAGALDRIGPDGTQVSDTWSPYCENTKKIIGLDLKRPISKSHTVTQPKRTSIEE